MAGSLVSRLKPTGIPFWRRISRCGKSIRRWFSRREWSLWLLSLWSAPEARDEAGLVMVQIDGLGRAQLERALREGRMPFLRRLLQREGYDLHTLYSGMPSTTPAVQGELFYGVKTAVPAFSFREAWSGKIMDMVTPQAALRRQEQLSQQGTGLLLDGSAYSDIYTGGAAEPHFCPTTMGLGNVIRNATVPRILLVVIWNTFALVRIAILAFVELLVAMKDAFQGLRAGHHWWPELALVPSRVAIGVIARELIAISAEIDATRGLPIIHLNLLGYDEQSHRRGPSSLFAHWTLRQIDRSIQRVSDAAFRSPRRDYQVWIYSDHGQLATQPYSVVRGKTLQNVVLDLYENTGDDSGPSPQLPAGIESQRSTRLGGGMAQRLLPELGLEDYLLETQLPAVAGKGPVAHIYWPTKLSTELLHQLSARLTQQEQVPLVFFLDENDGVLAWNEHGCYRLPEDKAAIFGEDHPFLAELAEDWMQLCRHPEAGTFIASGWDRAGKSVSFVTENGSHAGPSPEESGAFALLPREAPLSSENHEYIRPENLRHAALHVLGRDRQVRDASSAGQRPPTALRVMTYNVHSCIGMDGKVSPRRIARLIAQSGADIIALQELDVGKFRSGKQDQAHAIAQELAMEFHFHSVMNLEEEKYGNAIISRFPMRLVQADKLPRLWPQSKNETRGALWVEITVGDLALQVINTHLGLSAKERFAHIQTLLGPQWLGHPQCRGSVIFCGDLNAGPGSPTYKAIVSRLRDVQIEFSAGRPQKTWSSIYPLRRIDYIFSHGDLPVTFVHVPRTQLSTVASDHLPLIADFQIQESNVTYQKCMMYRR